MQDYSCIYVSGKVLTHRNYSPFTWSETTQKCFQAISRKAYTYKKQIATLIFRILSVSFCFCKICINRIFTQDKQSQDSQHRALKNPGNKIEVQAFSFTCIFYLKYSRHFCWDITFIRLSYFFRRPAWRECTEKKVQKGTRRDLKNFSKNSISKSKNDILILKYTFKELEFEVYWNK